MSRGARIVLGIFVVFLAALGVTIWIAISRFSPIARQYALSALREQYHSDVEMGALNISLFPVVKATGDNLVFRLAGHKEGPPLIKIRRFTVQARLIGFFRSPKRIRLLELDGLEVHIPPHASVQSNRSGSSQGSGVPLIFEEVIANGAVLQTLPADPSKDPLDFEIGELTMRHVGLHMPMTFHGRVTNPKPPGFIHTDGRFGPWQRDDPSQTPVSGTYTFRDADLSVFHGISGRLASDGNYGGTLDRIDVHGTADVPNFALTSAHHPMPLKTAFDATVDGTDGDTVLHPVYATLGSSRFEVSGAIERHALEKHKTISLETSGSGDHIEDFLRAAIPGKPPMTGGIVFKAHVTMPPGETEVIRRLKLDGTFDLSAIRFTSVDVQQKIDSLSHHALGEPKAPDRQAVPAAFSGRFRMNHGTIALPELHFSVPGALVTLRGTYEVSSGAIDMQGHAKLDATISQMTTGLKHFLLIPVDPLFRRDGAGAVLPIKIGGTRGQPSFKLDIGRVITRN